MTSGFANRTDAAYQLAAHLQHLRQAPREVVLDDDGEATGHTLLSTVELVRQQAPARMVVAVPVSSPQALGRLQAVADEVAWLLAPPNFQAVGQFYQDFTHVTDEEVVAVLHATERPPAPIQPAADAAHPTSFYANGTQPIHHGPKRLPRWLTLH